MSINAARALQRSIDTARLHVPTIEEIEADDTSTIEAGLIVVVSGIIGSVGSVLLGSGLWGFLAWTIATIVGWYVWAFVSTKVARELFGVPTTDQGEMLRVIGYGSAPRALGLIPYLGFFAALWTLAVVVTGIRQAGEMTRWQAVLTALIGLVPTIIAYVLISALL